MNNTIIKALNNRYATKVFDVSKKIDTDTLATIEESLRLAPSSFGLEGRGFVIISNAELQEKMQAAARNQPQLTTASHVIVLCRSTKPGKELTSGLLNNIMKTRNVSEADVSGFAGMLDQAVSSMTAEQLATRLAKQTYIAAGFAMMTCAILGVDSCSMEGFSTTDFDKILELDKLNLASVTLLPIGYRDASDKYANLPKVRYSKDEVIFHK